MDGRSGWAISASDAAGQVLRLPKQTLTLTNGGPDALIG